MEKYSSGDDEDYSSAGGHNDTLITPRAVLPAMNILQKAKEGDIRPLTRHKSDTLMDQELSIKKTGYFSNLEDIEIEMLSLNQKQQPI
jgi:hypothetical protein